MMQHLTLLRSVSSCFVLLMLCDCGVEARLRGNKNKNDGRNSAGSLRGLQTSDLTPIEEKVNDLSNPPPIEEKVNDLEMNDLELMTSAEILQLPPWHGATTTDYNEGGIRIKSPSSNPNDTLFLFLSRSDGPLPFSLDGWTRGAECFKAKNKQKKCWIYSDCEKMDGEYCDRFEDGDSDNFPDLVTVVFFKKADAQQTEFTFDIPESPHEKVSPAWAIMTAIQGVDATDPVRHFETESCDGEKTSVFPSIEDGRKGDILLLSMAFDDAESSDNFRAPSDTELLGYESGDDETGILFGKRLFENGPTGEFETDGSGGVKCKDALISMTLKPAL